MVQLHATLPLCIFISPNLPLDENNNLIRQVSQAAATDSLCLAPPLYGEHQFDQLYSDVDPSGYMTPAGAASGVATPWHSQSRGGSSDNLASMDTLASSNFAANALRNRLSDLDVTGSNRFARDRSHLSMSGDETLEMREGPRGEDGYHSSLPRNGYRDNSTANTSRHSNSTPSSRRVSGEDAGPTREHTPEHIEFGAQDLCKVPSYTTALQSLTRTPINDGLPNYQAAIRVPLPSPPLPRSPGLAHVTDRRVTS